MQRELYIDISTESSGGSLYRITDEKGSTTFRYEHSTYNDDRDEIKIFETIYPTFSDFWKMLTKDKVWYYQHPMFVHAEQRDFIKQQLQTVNWNIYPDPKWQESHQRQWRKVLTSNDDYYRSKT